MIPSDQQGFNSNPNERSRDRQREQDSTARDETTTHQFGVDLVISSAASAGAWIAATFPVYLEEVA